MNKNKGFVGIGIIVAIVVGVAVVGGGAYYLGKGGENQKIEKATEREFMSDEYQKLPVVDSEKEDKITPTKSSVTVVSPNGGEIYKDSDKISIKWKGLWKDKIDIYLRSSGGDWCFVKDLPSSATNYVFTPLGHNCTNGKTISSSQFKVTLISYEDKGLAPEPGTAFAGKYNDGNDGYFDIDSSDNYFTINSVKSVSLDMSSEIARTYKTAFMEALKQPANFNGHYSIASFGCGAGVMCYGIVDKLNGKAYSAPADDYNNLSGYFGDENFDKTRWSINSNIFKVIGYTSIDSYKFENDKFTKIESNPFPIIWKTYINEKYGFSFQYPDNWSQWGGESDVVCDLKTGAACAYMIDFMDIYSQGIESYDGEIIRSDAAKDELHVEYHYDSKGSELYQYALSQYGSKPEIYNYKKIKVADRTAIVTDNVLTVNGKGQAMIPLHVTSVIFLDKNEKGAFQFAFKTPKAYENTEIPKFEKLLTTFRFK